MREKIIIAVITAILAVPTTWFGRLPVEDWFSSQHRRRNNIPEITETRWNAEWRAEDGSLYVNDKVTLSMWTKNNQFEGYGEVTYGDKEYKYSIAGEVSPSRVVVLNYKAEKYPTEANIGTACLELSTSAQEMKGNWTGFGTKLLPDGNAVHTLRSGAVTLHRIK